MTERISPRVDIAFKKIFGVEENKDLLISLINSVVSDEDQVADLTLLNPYNPQSFKTDKLSILDVKAKGLDGKMFNIEIQITDSADYDKRALYYWSKLYIEQLKTSQGYSKLSKAIGIHILNFTSIPHVTKYHNVFHITEKESGITYFKDLELHTIELNKFSSNGNEELSDIVAKVKNSLDMWSAFLTRNDLLNPDNLPKELNSPTIKKAISVLDVMNFSPIEREAYEDHLKWLMTEAETLKKAEAKAREEGRVEGEAIGEARGEEKKAIEMARKMLAKDKPIEEITEFTSLTPAQIAKLKSS